MISPKTNPDLAISVIDACVGHADRMLMSQLPFTESKNYDLMPTFKEVATQLYLVGVMWRFGEQFELPTSSRDRGFICLMSIFIRNGMSEAEAQRRVAHLNEISRTADGRDTLALAAGYSATVGDGTLANVFEQFRDVPELSGAPYRLLSRAKLVAATLAGTAFVISVSSGGGWSFAFGIAVVVGVSVLGLALVIYRNMVKPSAR